MNRLPIAATARAPATGAPAPPAREDRLLALGWKVDPARDRLGPRAIIYTWYRDRARREGAVVTTSCSRCPDTLPRRIGGDTTTPAALAADGADPCPPTEAPASRP